MLAGVKKRWDERRAEVAADLIEDFLLLFEQLPPRCRHQVVFAFVEVRSSMEAQFGQSLLWPDSTRRRVVRHLEAGVRQGRKLHDTGISRHIERLSSYGVAFLGHYFEAQGLPGPRASQVVDRVGDWRNENGV